MGVANEAGDSRGVANNRPAVLVEVHTNKHVSGDAHAGDHLALAVFDLDDIFHRNFALVDEVFHRHGLLAVLNVRLHATLETGVGVNDVPLAWQKAQFLAERLVRVDLFIGRLGLACSFGGDGLVFVFDGFDGRVGFLRRIDVECVVDDGVGFGIG